MQMRYDRCPNCMQSLSGNDDVCPYCGFEIANYEERTTCLRPFTVLQNKYMLGRVIGVGGFGITYIGWDLNLQTYIAIKEYFPESLASRDTSGENGSNQVVPHDAQKDIYDKGLKRYVEEAQNLSKFYQLQGIVSVKDFFYENGTAYIVMEYINGINLKEYLNNSGGRLPEATVLALMKPVLESLFQIHNSGLVHRDISPDNIMVTSDGKIKLIDFGSARGQSSESDKTYTVILKHGYAPPEQYYAKGNQGPWTDIYSLCAAMYKMLTGQIPPNSVERMENDEYVQPSAWGVPVSPRTEAVLARGLAVKVNERYQNIGELLNDLYGTQPIMPGNTMPNAGSTAYANPASMSQQSMHFSMQQQPLDNNANQKSDSKRNLIIIISAAVAVIVLAIVLVLVLGGRSKPKPATTEKTTASVATSDDADTTEKETTEAATEEPTATGYVWPTEMSDNWDDYMVNINGTIYQFPMPYNEWASKGWQTSEMPVDVASGDYEYADYTDGKVELTAVFANFGVNEASATECYIVGVTFDSTYDNYSDDTKIELAAGVKLFEANEESIKAAYGAPDYRYEGSDYISLDYYGDDYLDGIDLELRNDSLTGISIINTQMPEEANIDISDIETAPPEINSSYVAPTGPSTDRFDGIVTLDGVNYQLPVPVSELTANGWVLDSSTDEYLISGDSCYTEMQKNGNKISITIRNYTKNAILPVNAYLTSIATDMDYCSLEVVFPGGIKLGDNASAFESVYGDLGDDYSKDEYSSFISYDASKYDYDASESIYISAYAEPDTLILDEYTYSRQLYNMEQ